MAMKNKYYFLLIWLISLSGCKKFLQEDPQGILVGDIALSNENGLEAQLAGAYSPLMQAWSSGFASSAQIGLSMGGDDVTTHPVSNKEDFRQFDQLAVTPADARADEVWSGCYKSIQSANNIISNYEKVTGDQDHIKEMAGEAFFLRGMCYYYLVRWWGKIPLVTSANFDPSMLEMNSSEITDVYKLIEDDLKKAEEMVGDVKLAPGRINKGTVKAYLADVYLTESGWPVKDASKAALAAQKAKEVMDNKATYGFDLYQGDFNKIFAGGTPEDVFALHTDHVAISNVYYGMSGMPGDEGGWDDYFAEINFFNDFPAGNRKDGTFLTSVNDGALQWQNFATKHPYYRKFRIQSADSINYASNSPIIMMRYANVLLVYAEAEARSVGPDASAYDAINAVRVRAGLIPLTPGLSADDFIKAVLDERGWEFAAEWTRWFDMVRTETVAEVLSHRSPNENVKLLGDPGDKKNWLFPIPGTDKSKSPNL
jgi:hypothetical protein